MVRLIEKDNYKVLVMSEATVEEVCFYRFHDMLNMKHALLGAKMFSIVSSPCDLENCNFKNIEVAPQWLKEIM